MNILYGILDTLLPFDMFRFAFMKNALLALLLIAPLLGLLGTMAVNNRMAYFSDALGHSALTGIAIGVLLGLCVPRRSRKWAALGAGAAFIATYIPLMAGFVPHLVRELREDGDAD